MKSVICVGSRNKIDEQKLYGLEAEVLELRTGLKEAKHRNLLLEEQLEQARYVNTMYLFCLLYTSPSPRD